MWRALRRLEMWFVTFVLWAIGFPLLTWMMTWQDTSRPARPSFGYGVFVDIVGALVMAAVVTLITPRWNRFVARWRPPAAEPKRPAAPLGRSAGKKAQRVTSSFSPPGIPRRVAVLKAALAQILTGFGGKVLIRIDGAGASHELMEWLTPRGVGQPPHVRSCVVVRSPRRRPVDPPRPVDAVRDRARCPARQAGLPGCGKPLPVRGSKA